MEPEERQRAQQQAWETHVRIFKSLPGAQGLTKLYGGVPSFHDGEVERVQLNKRGKSSVRVSVGFADHFAGQGHVFITLTIGEIIDVDLDGFSPQNVLQDFWLRPATVRPERQNKYWRKLESEDLEIELDPIYGIGGTIIARGLAVSWSKDRRARRKG